VTRLRLFFAATLAGTALLLAAAACAQAATLCVAPEKATFAEGSPCSEQQAFTTIAGAIEKSRELKEAHQGEAAEILVHAGKYEEDLELTPADDGLTVLGEEPSKTVIEGVGDGPTITEDERASVALADLTVHNSAADAEPAIRYDGTLVLVEVDVEAWGESAKGGVIGGLYGAAGLDLYGGRVALGERATGAALETTGPTLIKGAQIETSAPGAVGVKASYDATVEGSTFVGRGKNAVDATIAEAPPGDAPAELRMLVDRVETTAEDAAAYAAAAGSLYAGGSRFATKGPDSVALGQETGRLTLEHSEAVTEGTRTVEKVEGDGVRASTARRAGGIAPAGVIAAGANGSVGVYSNEAPVRINESRVLMNTGGDRGAGIETHGEEPVELLRTNVGGGWAGPGASLAGGRLHLYATNITASGSGAPALAAESASSPVGLWVQRSTLRAAGGAPAALEFEPYAGDGVVESSVLIGGRAALLVAPPSGARASQTLVVGSTLNAGTPGYALQPGLHSIEERVAGGGERSAVHAIGSVLFEPVTSALEEGAGEATITCAYSEAPNESRAAGPANGAIACADNQRANHNFAWPGAIFVSPFSGFRLRSGTHAIDSVPYRAISLPGGLRPSSTDLVGQPRWVKAQLAGRCVLTLDRGARQTRRQKNNCPVRHRRRRRRRRR